MSTLEKGDIGSDAQYIIALIEESTVSLSAMSALRLMIDSTVSRVVSRTGTFVINHKCQKAGFHKQVDWEADTPLHSSIGVKGSSIEKKGLLLNIGAPVNLLTMVQSNVRILG